LLAAEVAGQPMVRAVQVRLALRRLGHGELSAITPVTLGRQLKAYVDGGAESTLASSVVTEWLASPRTDREIRNFLRGSNRIWVDEFAQWFHSATRTQATNVWAYLAEQGYKPWVLSRTGSIQELDGARLEGALRKLAQSDSEERRTRAVKAVEALPASRADARRVAQFVAGDIAHRSPAERAAAVRLVGDRPPLRLMTEARVQLTAIPYSAWTRRQDKDFAKRLGIKKRSRGLRRDKRTRR
jgi:hypothetical protein